MTSGVPSLLAQWSSFYIMVGSSAAALTGLMFVVITLVRSSERVSRSHDGIATFSTPTVLHFCAALLVAALVSAPWHSLVQPAVLIGLTGLYGLAHVSRVALLARRIREYSPDAEDWVWYTVLPLVAYATILGSAIATFPAPEHALFVLAGGVVLLIFVGIRNAWDVVTFLAIRD